ncbi:TniB family NTP-binding protein [Pseudoxanthomonas sp. Soil82]|uniref:TniB family NTP-binding protein n=1 Tax=Pseudoxanthomonas sp. Soil82 TaxID=3157341 RepID=UPI00338EEF31
MKIPSHLHPSIAEQLHLDPQARCDLMKSQRFIPYPAGMAALRWMRYLYTNECGRSRPRSLHLIGQAGMGKSCVLEHYANLHGQEQRDTEGHRARPVVLVEMRHVDAKSLCTDLIKACIPEFRTTRPANYLDRLGPALVQCGVRQILIDEAGNLLLGGKHTQQQCLALLKSISNQGITICIATTEKMKAVLAADEQLYSRFRQAQLPHWSESQEFRQFLAGLEAQLPLPEPSYLDRVQVVRWLLSQGFTVTSAIVDLLRDAATSAIMAGRPHITLDLLRETATAVMPPDSTG